MDDTPSIHDVVGKIAHPTHTGLPAAEVECREVCGIKRTVGGIAV